MTTRFKSLTDPKERVVVQRQLDELQHNVLGNYERMAAGVREEFAKVRAECAESDAEIQTMALDLHNSLNVRFVKEQARLTELELYLLMRFHRLEQRQWTERCVAAWAKVRRGVGVAVRFASNLLTWGD